MGEHLGDISAMRDTSVAAHFNSGGHTVEDFVFIALCHAPADEEDRIQLENKIIFHFQAHLPPGLNRAFNFL